jgi:hypothetical protein
VGITIDPFQGGFKLRIDFQLSFEILAFRANISIGRLGSNLSNPFENNLRHHIAPCAFHALWLSSLFAPACPEWRLSYVASFSSRHDQMKTADP